VGLVEPRPDEDGGDVDDAVGRGRRRVGSFRRVTSTCTRGDDEGHRDDESTAGGRKTRNSGRSSQRRRDSFDPAGFSRAERSNRRLPPPTYTHSAGPTRGLGSPKRLDDPGDPVARVADLWLPTRPQPSGAGLEITMPRKIQRPPSRFAVTVPNFVSPACCTTASRGRPRRRCPATQDPRTTCARVCPHWSWEELVGSLSMEAERSVARDDLS
jgi:hypothetical protein